MFDNHIDYNRQTFSILFFFLYSLDLNVVHAQRILGFFILITQKSTRSENPITWGICIREDLERTSAPSCSSIPTLGQKRARDQLERGQGDGVFSPVNARKVTTNIDSFSVSVTALIFFYVKYSSIFIVSLPSTRSADTAETTIICQLEINCLLTVRPKLDHLLLDVPENSRSNFVRISYLRRLQVVIKNEGI